MFKITKTETTCSNHPDVTAVSYCRTCKKFMCAKCEGHHNEFWEKDHEGSVVPAGSAGNNSDNPYCDKCQVHIEYPLDTVCKDCNGTPSVSSFPLLFHFLKFSPLLYEVQVGRKPQKPQHCPPQ